MEEKHRKLILAFAENNMNIKATARQLYRGHTTVSYHLAKIQQQYGLDPKRFWDLVMLTEMAKGGDR